ncbi:MAG: hypothetical protein MUF86_08850 [Akkermansiaceae bacterium]|nr:hypothetical protein [Akkermansiaceae bacterium]
MKKRSGIIPVLVMVVIVAGILVGYRRAIYPYGHSHCCILGMMLALEEYAEENGGKYPAGRESPEADLSLLFKSQLVDANALRGMTVPEKVVQQILDRGDLLGPESCGWQYVSGLTLADDPGLALLWCKEALNHNGRRSKDGGREVVFVGADRRWISGDRWPAFLKQQEDLMRHRSRREIDGEPLVSGLVELPDGSRIDHVDASYTMMEESKGPNSSGSGRSSGSGLSSSRLIWYRAPLLNGQVTRTLSFSNLVSNPVTVTFENGLPDVTEVVFRMRPNQ